MSDDGLFFLIMGFWGVVGYAAYLRIFVIRRLNKKLDKFVDAAILRHPRTPAVDFDDAPESRSELRKMQERLQVLERIAVEKDDTLSREIDELRRAG